MESKNSPPTKPFGVNRTGRDRPTVQTGRPAQNREITYHVGWKTGKINADLPHPPHSQQHLPHALPFAEDGTPANPLVAAFLRWAWHPAPWLPKQVLWPLLWCAPVICFAVTLAVVALLKY
jgi:hypothetical protein